MSQQQWKERASRVLPAGGFGNFDPGIVIREGREAHVWDEDSNRYIDYLIGSGPMLLGHGHPDVLNAVREQLDLGTTFFANNARGIELAEVICDAMACAEQLRYVSTGGGSPKKIAATILKSGGRRDSASGSAVKYRASPRSSSQISGKRSPIP